MSWVEVPQKQTERPRCFIWAGRGGGFPGKTGQRVGGGTRKVSRPSKGVTSMAVSKVSSEDSLRADPIGGKRAEVFMPLNQSVVG